MPKTYVHRLVATAVMLPALVACACVPAQAAPIKFTARADTQASVYLHSSNPVVFEIGKLGIPWRRVNDVNDSGHVLKWGVRKGRTYEAWDATEYARAQLGVAATIMDHQFDAGRDLTEALLRAVRWTQSQTNRPGREIALARLGSALEALLRIQIGIQAGVGGKLWPEYTLPITCTFTSGTRGVSARLAALIKPDNWKQISTRSIPRKLDTVLVRVPPAATRYQGSYPIIARYAVSYRGVRFDVSNAVEAWVIDAFEREASIETISDTQIDLRIHLKSLLPIRGVKTEPYVPEGWTATASPKVFDVANSRTVTYRITRPKGEKPGLRIVGGTFEAGGFTTSKRLISDHALNLGETAAVTGFKLLKVAGKTPPVVTINDRQCRQVPASGRMPFDVSPNFSPGKETYLTLVCAATGSASIAVDYVTTSGRRQSTEPKELDAGSGSHRLVFVLRDASFDGKLPDGADFSVRCSGAMPGIAELHISRFRTSETETTSD